MTEDARHSAMQGFTKDQTLGESAKDPLTYS